MIDQSHNDKPKIEAMIQTVEQLQRAYAKALCVNGSALGAAQGNGDIVGSEECYIRAFNLDVRALLWAARERLGVPSEPLAAFRKSGHYTGLAEKRAATRRATGGLG